MLQYPVALLDRLSQAIDPIAADDPIAGRYRARQIRTIVRFAPLIGAGNLVNGILVWWSLRGGPDSLWLGLWLIALSAAVVYGMRPWWRTRRSAAPTSVSRRAIWAATRAAAVLGLLWSVPVMLMLSGADTDQRLLLTAVSTGMVCTGGFVLAAVPTAAVAFVGTLGTVTLVSLAGSGHSLSGELTLLFASYAMVALGGIALVGRSFLGQLLSELRAEQQREDIGLLLRDFEASTNDVLWETDGDDVLVEPSSRLLSMLHTTRRDALGIRFVTILARSDRFQDRRTERPLSDLIQRLKLGAPFRELVLRLEFGQESRWLSLTGRPVRGHDGEVRGWRGVIADVTANREAHNRLIELAHRDSLTGLANRHEFMQRLERALEDCSSACALIYVDLDGFKAVNDSLGHQAGDALLVAAAQRLREVVGSHGLAARLGGDEFAILLCETDGRSAADFAARLSSALERPCSIGASRTRIAASIGAAVAPDHGDGVEALMTSADLALYNAKHQGRGRWRVYDHMLGERDRRRRDVIRELRCALERNELSLVYQPQVCARGLHVVGFEALLRWSNPALGRVRPDEFIAIAEESGLIVDIGRWVLASACRQAARWPSQLRVSVNVSPAQVIGASLADSVEEALAASGLESGRLELEITESLLLENSPETVARLHELRRRGVKFALDDFGRGYSSLAYLRRFPFETLKIDREFVSAIDSAPENRAIVRTVIDLARALGMETVAEGVEHPGELAVLRELGCELIQGYLVSRPLSAHDADTLARNLLPERQSSPIETLAIV